LPSSPEPDRTQRLADVYARADRLRRQRRARLGTGALLGSLAVFMVGLLVGTNLGIPQQLTTIGRPDVPSTSTTERPSTTTTTGLPVEPGPEAAQEFTPPGREAPVQQPPPTSQPQRPPATTTPTTEPAATTSTTAPGCRNSRDPACGPFRYDPPPVNAEMNVQVTYSPPDPKPGDEITFTVRVSDDGPAEPGSRNCNEASFGDEDTAMACSASCIPREPRHGPWDPPIPENTSFEETLRHVYADSGTYTATFSYNQGGNCTQNPYHSEGEASVTVTVR
jgi:hypothetical protein